MLQYITVEPRTLDLLRSLMKIPELQDFYLVGGTALSLIYGHRNSIDLDLFSTKEFDNETVICAIRDRFPSFTYNSRPDPVGIFGFIEDVKVDLIKYHQHQQIAPPLIEEGLRLMSINDLMAMKIAAILKRGVKKDFWDISEMLKHYSLDEMIKAYDTKFPNNQLLISIPQALTYFDDANESEEPISLKGQTWSKVKHHIQSKVNAYFN